MICVAVKMKPGPKAVKIKAGNSCAQYVCCAGLVATKMHATQDAKPPTARIYCAGKCEIAQKLMKAAAAPIIARVTYVAALAKIV